jgi:hypothetical protein
VKYRYDLPYQTLSNGYAACSGSDLLYVLDGIFTNNNNATQAGTNDVFFADGVVCTNITFIFTNKLVSNSYDTNHVFGRGFFTADGTAIHDQGFFVGSVTANSNSMSLSIECKTILYPTNVPAILIGRGGQYTNYLHIKCSDAFVGQIEMDDSGDFHEYGYADVTAPYIYAGHGSSSVGFQGNSGEQTNRFYTYYPGQMVLATGSGISLFDYCTITINGGQLNDIRLNNGFSKHHTVVLNGVHFKDPTALSGNTNYGTWFIDGQNPAQATFGQLGTTNYPGSSLVSTSASFQGMVIAPSSSFLNAPTNNSDSLEVFGQSTFSNVVIYGNSAGASGSLAINTNNVAFSGDVLDVWGNAQLTNTIIATGGSLAIGTNNVAAGGNLLQVWGKAYLPSNTAPVTVVSNTPESAGLYYTNNSLVRVTAQIPYWNSWSSAVAGFAAAEIYIGVTNLDGTFLSPITQTNSTRLTIGFTNTENGVFNIPLGPGSYFIVQTATSGSSTVVLPAMTWVNCP